MFNPLFNGVNKPFKLIKGIEIEEMSKAESYCAVYYPGYGSCKIVLSDMGENMFNTYLIALLFNSHFYDFIKAVIVTADDFKKDPNKGHKLAEAFTEYLRIEDIRQLKNLYNA